MGAKVSVIEIDKGWKEIKGQVKKLKGSETRVGLFGSGGDASSNIAARAAVQEFGNRRWKNSEGRPFMRNAFDDNLKAIIDTITKEYGKLLDKRQSARSLVRRVGVFMSSKIKLEITTGKFRALTPSTIARKGSSRPLIDTGEMRNSIKHKDKVK